MSKEYTIRVMTLEDYDVVDGHPRFWNPFHR